jgi:mono/diheme cytochrome c family protein
VALSLLVLAAFTMAFAPSPNGKPWDIPAKYKSMKNPSAGKNIDLGKATYAKHCKSCHGAAGLGDGPKAKQLKTSCGDFSTKEFQGRADGVLYYQSFIGRDEMPNFEKKILTEEERWAVISFMRTMGK